jgi:hypothetical protein
MFYKTKIAVSVQVKTWHRFTKTSSYWALLFVECQEAPLIFHLINIVFTSCRLAYRINALNDVLNPICHLLALLGAHHILHISRVRVNVTLSADGRHTQRIAVRSNKRNL